MKSFAGLLFLAALAHSQPAQVQVNADCVVQFTTVPLTSSGAATQAVDNRRLGCNSWQIGYANNGFSAITLTIQEAPDNSGTPGSWSTLGGTATFGTNPNTNTTGASALIQSYGTSFAPWVRVALTSATGSGSVVGVLLGYRASGSAGTSGGASSNVTITSPLGSQGMAAGVSVSLPNNQVSGCTPTSVNLSGSGNTQILAASGSLNIYICDLEFSTGTPEDFKLTEGTGSNCAVGTADATALMKNISAWSLTPGGGYAGTKITRTAGDALCANQANAQAAAVTLWYLQQ